MWWLPFNCWWRNKVFFFISIVSLAIGLACTNLLFTYYVHDYNIESGNRDKNRIFCLRQDNPMQDGSKVAYADANIPPMLKEKYAETGALMAGHLKNTGMTDQTEYLSDITARTIEQYDLLAMEQSE